MKVLCGLIGLLALFSSCKERTIATKAITLTIDNSTIDSTADISSLIDNVSIVLLKEPPGNYMADVLKIAGTSNGRYLFYDLQTNKINAYTNDGAFIKTLSKAGDEANDPLNISDFWVLENGNIQVYDFAQMKVFEYDSSLRFKASVKSRQLNHFSGLQKIPGSEQYVGFAGFSSFNKPYKNNHYRIAVLDRNLDVFYTQDHYDKRYVGVNLLTYAQHFSRYKDTVRFYRPYDNNVYSISPIGITKRYAIRYVHHDLPEDIYPILDKHLPEFKDRSVESLRKLPSFFKDFTRFYGNWYENDKLIYFASYQEHTPKRIFYTIADKHTNATVHQAHTFTVGGTFGIQLPPFQYFDQSDNTLVAVVNGATLKQMLSPASQFNSTVQPDAQLLYLVKATLK